MKKNIFILLFAVLGLVSIGTYAKKPQEELGKDLQVRCIAFYNLENLFDTIHDEGKNDYEYLPDGGMKWTSLKYEHKIKNMAYAISQLGTDYDPRGAMCVGVAEVENIGCLQDLCRELKEKYNRNYDPILLEGPDRRGVDVGFLYNPDLFKPASVKGHELKAHYTDGGVVKSRLQLLISGYIIGGSGRPEKIHITVNHWPSRYGGELTSRPTRDTAAMLARQICDSIYQKEPRAKIILMGDLNDDPYNHSCAVVMNAKKDREDVGPQGFFNTMWRHLDNGVGTLAYQGSWNLFDQIMISEPLLNESLESGKWTYWKSQIFNKPFLTVQQGKFKGNPKRTTQSGVWQDGYGDHFPTMIYLIRK
ncbi:MAG: endonuclease/exonuclease/phosphatase family protein [Paludibacteraceae bacterium]|nr:endonuclease/exonuclease/phosphatase family protein [Paludibacteraceae bacterium]